MFVLAPQEAAFSDAWIEGDEGARWRSTAGHGPSTGAAASGSSLLEVPSGCRLPPHTDSAEETIVVTAGRAEVLVDGQGTHLDAGGIALVRARAPHEVRNAGEEPLRFAAVYAATDVVTRYQDEVQPDGSRERRPLG